MRYRTTPIRLCSDPDWRVQRAQTRKDGLRFTAARESLFSGALRNADRANTLPVTPPAAGPPPLSWPPDASPPTHPGPTGDSAPGYRTGGSPGRPRSPGSPPVCGARARARLPRVHEYRLEHAHPAPPRVLTAAGRRARRPSIQHQSGDRRPALQRDRLEAFHRLRAMRALPYPGERYRMGIDALCRGDRAVCCEAPGFAIPAPTGVMPARHGFRPRMQLIFVLRRASCPGAAHCGERGPKQPPQRRGALR